MAEFGKSFIDPNQMKKDIHSDYLMILCSFRRLRPRERRIDDLSQIATPSTQSLKRSLSATFSAPAGGPLTWIKEKIASMDSFDASEREAEMDFSIAPPALPISRIAIISSEQAGAIDRVGKR